MIQTNNIRNDDQKRKNKEIKKVAVDKNSEYSERDKIRENED
jgi:hypothetical protein